MPGLHCRLREGGAAYRLQGTVHVRELGLAAEGSTPSQNLTHILILFDRHKLVGHTLLILLLPGAIQFGLDLDSTPTKRHRCNTSYSFALSRTGLLPFA